MEFMPQIVFNAFWILGLAVLLALFSYADWLRHQTSPNQAPQSWRQIIARPAMSMAIFLGLTLFSVGVGLNRILVDQDALWWESALWILLSISFFIQTAVCGLAGESSKSELIDGGDNQR
jgi:hypothetical protein